MVNKSNTNNKRILKDAIFDNKEAIKKAVKDEIDIACSNFNERINSIIKRFKNHLIKKDK